LSLRKRTAWLLLAAGIVSTGAVAQVDEAVDARTPIEIGRVHFYPTYRAEVAWTDNLFYDNRNLSPVETYQVTMVPSLLFVLPFSESQVRFGYAYRTRAYTEDLNEDQSHYGLADGRLEFSNGFVLSYRDDFQTGVIDTKVFDPGGSVTFDGEKVETNYAALGLGYTTPTWEVQANGDTSYVNFPERTITSFYDVEGWGTGLTFRYRSSPIFRWYADFNISRTRLSIPADPDIGSTGELQIEYRQGTALGIEYDMAPGNLLRAELGVPYYEYKGDSPTDFRTLTGQVEYSRRIPATYAATFRLSRAAYPTTYLDSNYYVDERVAVELGNDQSAKLVFGGDATYYWNRYPGIPSLTIFDGAKRTDKTIEGEAYVGYRFGSGMVWRVYFRGETRKSTIGLFEYGKGTIGTTFVIGG
jgi:hypothetical protein